MVSVFGVMLQGNVVLHATKLSSNKSLRHLQHFRWLQASPLLLFITPASRGCCSVHTPQIMNHNFNYLLQITTISSSTYQRTGWTDLIWGTQYSHNDSGLCLFIFFFLKKGWETLMDDWTSLPTEESKLGQKRESTEMIICKVQSLPFQPGCSSSHGLVWFGLVSSLFCFIFWKIPTGTPD